MGVDISHIIKHDFHEVENEQATEEFVKKTMRQLKKNLLIQADDDLWEYNYDEDETTFKLPVYDVEFTLHNGFWQIDGRSDRFVTKPLLYGLNILTGVKQVGCVGVAQGMGGQSRVKPSLVQSLLEARADERIINLAVLAELLEDEVLARVILTESLQYGDHTGGDWHNTVLTALALLDMYLLAVEVDVVPLQVAGLKGTESAVIDNG